jgi:hypothetical protein
MALACLRTIDLTPKPFPGFLSVKGFFLPTSDVVSNFELYPRIRPSSRSRRLDGPGSPEPAAVMNEPGQTKNLKLRLFPGKAAV